ncbi:MAG TPA: hypothetical protein VFW45_11445 [Candidatus Polarisedimenticolia bacterium]|nr:hypothetical protein [Candidatus Polarisedimenticolia bacterium]
MAVPHVHDPIDILELEITCTTLQNEVLMRYVTSPDANLPRIRRILKRAFDDLAGLAVAKDMVRCPDGWVHAMCRCVVPTLKDLSYKSNGKGMQTSKRRTVLPIATSSPSGSSGPRAPKGN